MHSLAVSSSWKELGLSGVPLPWVATRMQICFVISNLSPRVGSLTAQVVTVDAVDILEWDRRDGPMHVGWK